MLKTEQRSLVRVVIINSDVSICYICTVVPRNSSDRVLRNLGADKDLRKIWEAKDESKLNGKTLAELFLDSVSKLWS
jgi:hypothetical protein